MAYTVLARKYRSRGFDELVGQEPISRTLRAAIEQDRVAHAYLFCGTRGVGKTSAARIFADALNNPDQDPEIAEAIRTGQDVDVIEIDAASNRGVDEARDLIANAGYRPMRGRSKIYIVDEVHMLTKEAFNALLKTMEEPPAHVKFILCTTDPQKVPATIQSRCQRFDFRNIPTTSIADHLGAVVEAEGAKAEPELLHAVARLGAGSMRDALSLLDRIMASGETGLTLALLEELLGLPDRDIVSGLIDALGSGDPGAALEKADALLQTGAGPDQALEALAERLRDLMVLAACGPETALVDLTGDTRAAEVERSKMFDEAGLVHMIALCESVQRTLRSSSSGRALFDAAIVRMALTEKLADVTAVVTTARAGTRAGPEFAAKKP